LSKYEDLCAAYAAARKSFAAGRSAALKQAEQVVAGLVGYLGCDKRHIRFARFNTREEEKPNYTLDEVLRIVSGNTYSFGLGLTLFETAGAPPAETLLIGISIEPVAGGYILYAKGLTEKYRLLLTADNSHVLSNFYETLFRRIRENYKTPYLRFPAGEHTERELGG